MLHRWMRAERFRTVSWQATAWADDLPYETMKSYLAYRVLIKLCNNADKYGRRAWRSNDELAVELGVSKRSVQRALRELEQAMLIVPGDQEFVRHLRADRRPTVYDMNLRYREEFAQPELPIGDQSHGVTELSTATPRGDNWGLNGVTTGVAHRTTLEPSNSSTKGNHRRAVTPSPRAGTRSGIQHLGICDTGKPHRVRQDGYCADCWEPIDPTGASLGPPLGSKA